VFIPPTTTVTAPPPPPPPSSSGAPSGLFAAISGFSKSTLTSVPTADKPTLTGIAAGVEEGLKGLKTTTIAVKPKEKKPMSELEKKLAKRRGKMAGDEPDDEEEEKEKLEELKEREEEAQREAQVELEKQNEILEELRNQNLALIRKLHQSGRTPQFIDVVKIEAADMTKAKEQRLALQKVPKATTVKVKQAREKKRDDIAKVKDLIAKAKVDGKPTAGLQGDLDKFLNTTTMKTPEGVPIVGTGKTKIAKKVKPIFDDTIDYVATALDLWMRCRNASKANPKKGPCGRMGKGKLKRMTQKEAMMAVEKLEKKLVKLS